MIPMLIVLAVVAAVGTVYFAFRNRDFLKFISGAFFVSGGIQLYMYFAKVSVPSWGPIWFRRPP